MAASATLVIVWYGRRHVALMIEIRYEYRILVVKSERSRLLGVVGCWREDNIKMNVRAMRYNYWDWILPAQLYVNTLMNIRIAFDIFMDEISNCQLMQDKSTPWSWLQQANVKSWVSNDFAVSHSTVASFSCQGVADACHHKNGPHRKELLKV